MEYPINEQPRPAKRKPRSDWSGVLAGVLLFVLWSGLVFGGFYFTKQYMDHAIQSVQENNAMQMQAVEERLSAIQTEMEGIEEALQDTGKNLSSSESTREDLDEKIKALDEQLKRLGQSLNVLKEAPGN